MNSKRIPPHHGVGKFPHITVRDPSRASRCGKIPTHHGAGSFPAHHGVGKFPHIRCGELQFLDVKYGRIKQKILEQIDLIP
jgi:hypothetical protein